MSQIQLNIPDEVADEVIEALCEELEVASAANAKQEIIDWIKRKVKRRRGQAINADDLGLS